MNVVGQTQKSGFQAGARRTFGLAPDALWRLLVSADGQAALGATGALTATSPGVSTFVAGSHYRRLVDDGRLQVRVLSAARGATLALHLEKLTDAEHRAAVLTRFEAVLERFGVLIAGGATG